MNWIKHDTNSNQDAKLKKVRMKYGLEGYGLYWYCLELIAADVDKNNLTFELEHDAEIIAHDTGIHYERVNEMMAYMVNLKLFEENNGVMTCLKLASRLDKSMTSSPLMRKMLGDLKLSADGVMMPSALVMQDNTKEDETILNNTKLNNTKEEKEENTNTTSSLPAVATKPKFEADDHLFAEKMFERLLVNNLNHKKPNLDNWAIDIRKARTLDKRSLHVLWVAFDWASKDGFWSENILSPKKLREHFDKLIMKANKSHAAEQPRNLSPYGGNW